MIIILRTSGVGSRSKDPYSIGSMSSITRSIFLITVNTRVIGSPTIVTESCVVMPGDGFTTGRTIGIVTIISPYIIIISSSSIISGNICMPVPSICNNVINKSISCRRRTRATYSIVCIVLHTEVEAQRDKLAKVGGQTSTVANTVNVVRPTTVASS